MSDAVGWLGGCNRRGGNSRPERQRPRPTAYRIDRNLAGYIPNLQPPRKRKWPRRTPRPSDRINRGDQRCSIPNPRHLAVLQRVASFPIVEMWEQVVVVSGYQSLPRKPRARCNAAAFGLRCWGYGTIGEVCEASGVSDSTLTGWEGTVVPAMLRVDGVRVIPKDEFEAYVASCRRAAEQRCRHGRDYCV